MFEWLEENEIREWLTLLFAAMAAAVPWLIFKRKARVLAKEAADFESSKWSVHLRSHLDSRIEPVDVFTWCELRLEDARDNRYRLISLAIRKPRGAGLTGFIVLPGLDAKYAPKPSEPLRKLEINQDLTRYQAFSSNGTTSLDHAERAMLIKMPPRPWYARSESTRVQIAAKLEDISSERRRTQIKILTPLIPWRKEDHE